MVRLEARTVEVKALRELAGKHGVTKVADNAGRKLVRSMVTALLAVESLPAEDKELVTKHHQQYEATWAAPGQGEEQGAEQEAKEWKFTAFQATYNSTEGEWASNDKTLLAAL